MRTRVTLQLPTVPLSGEPCSLKGAKVLLIGNGFVARALTPELIKAGAIVTHTTRGDEGISFGSDAMRDAFAAADIVLSSVPPMRNGSDPGLTALAGVRTGASWIGYLSATSVYGDRSGQWAFEGEAPTPSLARGQARAAAELNWLETHPATQVFRLAGIYGPGRAPFDRVWTGKARIVEAPNHVVNRIHVDDIVSALMASIARPSPQDIYNIADGHPAAPGDVLRYAATLLDVEPPPTVAVDHPSVSAMARTFYSETKRIDITRAKTRLGWEPRFSNFETGLRAVFDQRTKEAV
jgi:nucleoside-diphosphate-sugar epimerase